MKNHSNTFKHTHMHLFLLLLSLSLSFSFPVIIIATACLTRAVLCFKPLKEKWIVYKKANAVPMCITLLINK